MAYTDGLVERRSEDIDTGLCRLRETAEPLAALSLPAFVGEVLTAMRDADNPDDVAVLALRREAP